MSDGATPDGFDSRDNSSRGRDRLGTDRDVRDVPSGNLRALARTFLLVTALSIFGMAGVRADSLISLGALPGGAFQSDPRGISADGKTVVGDSPGETMGASGFIWTLQGGMTELPGLVPQVVVIAYATSSDGSVVVGSSGASSENIPEAVRWTKTGGPVGLGFLPGGFTSGALSVSGDGTTVVGWSSSSNAVPFPLTEAFVWTASGGMMGLGDLEGGAFSSEALGVSADGSVVVGLGSSELGTEAMRWTETAGMEGLGTLPGAVASEATAVSADGSVIVGFATNAEAYTEAFRWTQDEGMAGLGFPPGSSSSSAVGVSGDGSVVLGGGDVAGPCLWDAVHGWRPLHDLLEADGVDVDGSWQDLFETAAISADGRVVTGRGIDSQGRAFVGWVATIPEPEPQLLSAIAAVALVAMRGASPQAWRRRAQSRAAMIRQASGIKRPTP